MLDARNIYRKVSRAIFDFSPEQQKNIAAIVWLYRGQSGAVRQISGELSRPGRRLRVRRPPTRSQLFLKRRLAS